MKVRIEKESQLIPSMMAILRTRGDQGLVFVKDEVQ
jgi:hypothetical protein